MFFLKSLPSLTYYLTLSRIRNIFILSVSNSQLQRNSQLQLATRNCNSQLQLATRNCNSQLATRNSQLATRNSQLATRNCNSQLATRNSQLATRNSQLATRNSQLATRNSQLHNSHSSQTLLILFPCVIPENKLVSCLTKAKRIFTMNCLTRPRSYGNTESNLIFGSSVITK